MFLETNGLYSTLWPSKVKHHAGSSVAGIYWLIQTHKRRSRMRENIHIVSLRALLTASFEQRIERRSRGS
jgi:hypothetical protein